MRLTTRLVVPALALVLGASVAPAQQAPAAPAAPRSMMISVNPLGLVFGAISAELDRSLSRTSGMALSGSYFSPSGFTYASFDAKYKFQPSGNGMAGFYIGPTAGMTHVGVDASELVDCTQDCAESANAITAGLELGYQWLIGRESNFGIGTGIGAKKLFFVGETAGGASGTLPTLKLNVGWAF
jgi:hypothetical protein